MIKKTRKEEAKANQKLLDEINKSLCKIEGWGSIEIIIQNHQVMQITEKNIRKPIITIEKKI